MISVTEIVDVVIGVDTHIGTHSAAVVDTKTGGVLAQITVETTPGGLDELLALAQDYPTRAWAIEGTGCHGAGLARRLSSVGDIVIELDRPVRAKRRHGVKSDTSDAIRAAREAMTRTTLATPRAGGDRQALSVLLTTRESAIQGAGVAARQLFFLAVAAPEVLRARLREQNMPQMVRTVARWRVNPAWDTETATTATVMKTLAKRCQQLSREAAEHHTAILDIVKAWRPDLLAQPGVGPIVAATVLCAWSHPGRIHTEAAFAMLAGVAPIPATSGQITNRHRLNRSGDRQLNRALHTIVITRLGCHQPTRDYVARRTTEGKTGREIRRCLKRYIARDLYRLLERGTPPDTP